MPRHPRFSICLASLVLAAALPALASPIVNQVPRDALGFLLVRNLTQTDAKIAKAVNDLRLPLPSPFTIIKSLTGVSNGIDSDRDLLVVMLPPENNSRPFHLAVWLPVKDYDALVRSLDGDPQRRIAAATVAGEDVLIAHVEDWAVVMDPGQRERLNQLASDSVAVALPAAESMRFIGDDNDVSLVVLASGMQAAGRWAAIAGAATRPANDAADDHGTPGQIAPLHPVQPNDNSWRAVWQSFQSMIADAQELKRMAMEAKGFGCALRLDGAGNAVIKVRVGLSPDSALTASGAQSGKQYRVAAPQLFDGGPFVLSGSGQVSEHWAVPFVAPYVRQMAADLATEYNTKVDEADLGKLRIAIEQALAQTRAVSILSRPGADQDGVYTNSFLAVRVASAEEFLKQTGAAIDEWNAMLGKADGAIGLVFEKSPIAVDGRDGTEYAIDMAKAVGAGSLPEARQSMERLFGPGGRFRIQLIKVDDVTVLLSIAFEEQLARPIRAIQDKREAPATDDGKLHLVMPLLTGESDWQLYLSLDGYNRWLKRQMEAIVGPFIGGPIVRPFPESPPIGAAGGASQGTVWAEVAVPAETLRGIGQFLHP
jgi:hypothetical protein